MRTFKLFICALLCIAGATAQTPTDIKLKAPNKTRGTAVMKALADRRSTREFDSRQLTDQDLADLLWAACGVNRPDGKRTAPTARNRQEIDLYVIRANGAYRYDAPSHSLKLVSKNDLRADVAGAQTFAASAPVSLLIVADMKKLEAKTEAARMMGAADAGIVCQNINLFCAAAGLVTVPRATMDKEKLKKALQLTDDQVMVLNNPVGYPKK